MGGRSGLLLIGEVYIIMSVVCGGGGLVLTMQRYNIAQTRLIYKYFRYQFLCITGL